jgi:hypothetical protein
MRYLLIAGLVALTSACALDGTTAEDGESATSTQYVDILDFSGVDQGAFYDVRSKLDGELASAGYAGITSLGLACSVTSKVGNVHDCVWTFAGVATAVDPATSKIATSAPSYQCHFHPRTTGPKLVALLAGSSDALHETLPGTTASFADGLPACFANPIGAAPFTVTPSTSPTYVEASDYYTSATYRAEWAKAKAALKLGFDHVCGDTFCGGDYGNMQSLAFVCSVTKSTGNVKECAWVFEGSYAMPSKTGAEVVNVKSWRCEVPVKGTVSQLVSVVNSNTSDDVLRRALPGGTATAYDALLNCL